MKKKNRFETIEILWSQCFLNEDENVEVTLNLFQGLKMLKRVQDDCLMPHRVACPELAEGEPRCGRHKS